MPRSAEIYKRFGALQSRLEQVNSAWSYKDHENLVLFLVEALPKLMDAERCSIFISDSGSEKIWVKYGTGVVEKQIEAPRKGSFVGQAVCLGKPIIRNGLEKKSGFHSLTDRKTRFVTRNMICTPIESLTAREPVGAVQVLNRHCENGFCKSDELLLMRVVKYLSFALESARLNREIISISNTLRNDIELLKQGNRQQREFIACSENMRQLVDTVHKVSRYPINIHIYGESGSGKELISRMIHENSEFRDGPFVAVNCSSIPEHLMESEFLGHEKGAFTGAVASRCGHFEEAENGTLFLDEVGDMPLSIQPKFLRAIQEMEGSRIGGNELKTYRFRIVSASSKNLRKQVEKHKFREDLLFRLFALELAIPPLRDRKEDIVPLAMMFLETTCARFQKKTAGFSKGVLELFEQYRWPGNVRQLQREVERLVALTPCGLQLKCENCSCDLQGPLTVSQSAMLPFPTLEIAENKALLEKNLIQKAMEQSKGNKSKAARLLGITRQALHYKIKTMVQDGAWV